MARHKDKPEFRTTPLSPEEIAKFNILKKLSGKELLRRVPAWARAKAIPSRAEFIPGLPAKYPAWTHQQAMAPAELKFPGAHITDAKEYIAEFNRLNALKNPATARSASGDDVTAHELALFIISDGDLYRQQGFPIIQNLRRKIKRGVYDPEKAIKLWRYLADSGAKKYEYEHGGGRLVGTRGAVRSWREVKGYGIFSVPIRWQTARDLAAHYDEQVREKENPNREGYQHHAPFIVQVRRLGKWRDLVNFTNLQFAKNQATKFAHELRLSTRVIKR